MLQAEMLLGGLSSFGSQFKVWFRFVEQLVLVVPVEVKPLKSQSQLGTKMSHSDLMGTFKNTLSPSNPQVSN